MADAVPIASAKIALRSRLLAARAELPPDTRAAAADTIADNVSMLAATRAARCVCAYVSVTDEPGTRPLLDRLHADGIQVLLPLLLDDLDLDWACYRPGTLRPGRLGLLQPTAPALGVDAVQAAELIVCPGVAGTPGGARLGRGGGSYDKALGRARPASLRCLLLYDDEVLSQVPTEPHDQPVDVIATPSQILCTTSARRGF